jgi:hypothetical protein
MSIAFTRSQRGQLRILEDSVRDLTVVSERSAKEIQEQKATDTLKLALANLTGNLIQIVSGEGTPDQVIDQLLACVEACKEYIKAAGKEPSNALITQLLKYSTEFDNQIEDDRLGALAFENALCIMALQIVASTLMGQSTAREKAVIEMRTHLRGFENLR